MHIVRSRDYRILGLVERHVSEGGQKLKRKIYTCNSANSLQLTSLIKRAQPHLCPNNNNKKKKKIKGHFSRLAGWLSSREAWKSVLHAILEFVCLMFCMEGEAEAAGKGFNYSQEMNTFVGVVQMEMVQRLELLFWNSVR